MADVYAHEQHATTPPNIAYQVIDRSADPMTADVGVHHDRLPPGKYYRWVGHRWVLKAWYDRANRIRYPGPVPCLGCPVAIFRDWAARDPLRCHPFAPRLLDHSTLAFEEYAYCDVVIHLDPHGRESHKTCTMHLYRSDPSAPGGFEPQPYWMSIASPKFRVQLADHLFPQHHVPGTLLNAADMLRLAGMDPFPATPLLQPTKILWAKVRWAVAVRPWIKHWVEDHAKRQSAPGGKFYVEGVAAFEGEFCSSW